jgi:stage III sporulation protein AB
MIKLLLGAAIVCFTSFCGYVFAKKYRKRKNFFAQMNEFNERFLNEIAYYRRPVKEFIDKYAYTGEFNELLDAFLDHLGRTPKTGEAAFETESVFPVFPFLTADETHFISDYFLMLGKGDSGSQKAYFTSVKSTLEEYKKKSGEECGKYSDLYLKLGFLSGLLILVLII